MNNEITYTRTLEAVNWVQLKDQLVADMFDNGRTPEQLRRSFVNSAQTCFALLDEQVVGTGRVLSDGVCNAYLVDLWTYSPFRHQGIATEIVRLLCADLPGQHVYLQADEDLLPFYEKLGFQSQPHGISKVVGRWLDGRKPKPTVRR
jgi:GNAT superfamily N-acetyltransferase